VEKASDASERMAQRNADAEDVGQMKNVGTPDKAPYGKGERAADQPAVENETSVPYLERGREISVETVLVPVLDDVRDAGAYHAADDEGENEI
jgi:hypothetical protein